MRAMLLWPQLRRLAAQACFAEMPRSGDHFAGQEPVQSGPELDRAACEDGSEPDLLPGDPQIPRWRHYRTGFHRFWRASSDGHTLGNGMLGTRRDVIPLRRRRGSVPLRRVRPERVAQLCQGAGLFGISVWHFEHLAVIIESHFRASHA